MILSSCTGQGKIEMLLFLDEFGELAVLLSQLFGTWCISQETLIAKPVLIW